MPGDLAVQSVLHPPLASVAPQPSFTSPDPGKSTADQPPSGATSAVALHTKDPVAQVAGTGSGATPSAGSGTPSSAGAALYTNPVSRLDPALGIVILSFYNSQGVQTSSIPTQKQLASYRLHGDQTSPPADGAQGLPPEA